MRNENNNMIKTTKLFLEFFSLNIPYINAKTRHGCEREKCIFVKTETIYADLCCIYSLCVSLKGLNKTSE